MGYAGGGAAGVGRYQMVKEEEEEGVGYYQYRVRRCLWLLSLAVIGAICITLSVFVLVWGSRSCAAPDTPPGEGQRERQGERELVHKLHEIYKDNINQSKSFILPTF